MMMLGLYSAPPSQGGQLLLDCTPFIQRASCSTDAHGFEGLQAALSRPLRDAFRIYDAPVLSAGLFWGGQIVWEGRLEDPALSAGNQGSGLSLTALGAWRALSDLPYTALWSTTQLDRWRPITNTEFTANYSNPERYAIDTQNRIFIAPQKNAVYGNLANTGSMVFIPPDDGSRQLVAIQFDVELLLPNNWRFRVLSWTAGFGAASSIYSLATTGVLQTRSISVTLSANDYLSFEIANNTGGNYTYTGENGANYVRITNIRVASTSANFISTTLTNNETAGAGVTIEVGSTARMYIGQRLVINSGNSPSESVIVTAINSSTQFVATLANNHTAGSTVRAIVVYADEIVKDVVTATVTLNSAQLSSATVLIQSPGLDLTDQVYEDAAIGGILTNLASLGDTSGAAWESGVYEGRVLFFRAKGAASRAWYVDASDLSVARSLEQLANGIYPVYQDANGVAQRSAPTSDATSIARYGLTRRAALPVQTTIAATASLFVVTALADRKDPQPRASIQFDAVYDALGGRYPLWLVRAGDTITIRNLPPTISTSVDRIRTFRISHTSYNAVADTLAVEPELPLPTLEVMLARRAEGVAA